MLVMEWKIIEILCKIFLWFILRNWKGNSRIEIRENTRSRLMIDFFGQIIVQLLKNVELSEMTNL